MLLAPVGQEPVHTAQKTHQHKENGFTTQGVQKGISDNHPRQGRAATLRGAGTATPLIIVKGTTTDTTTHIDRGRQTSDTPTAVATRRCTGPTV